MEKMKMVVEARPDGFTLTTRCPLCGREVNLGAWGDEDVLGDLRGFFDPEPVPLLCLFVNRPYLSDEQVKTHLSFSRM